MAVLLPPSVFKVSDWICGWYVFFHLSFLFEENESVEVIRTVRVFLSFLVCYMKFSRWKRYVNEQRATSNKQYDINVKKEHIICSWLTDCVYLMYFVLFAFGFIHCLLFSHGHIFNFVTVCFIVATRAFCWQPSTKRYILSYWTRDG